MNLREAKKLTMSILDRWRFLSSRKTEPRFIVIKSRRNPQSRDVTPYIFKNHAHAMRFVEAQINPDFYSVVTLGGP